MSDREAAIREEQRRREDAALVDALAADEVRKRRGLEAELAAAREAVQVVRDNAATVERGLRHDIELERAALRQRAKDLDAAREREAKLRKALRLVEAGIRRGEGTEAEATEALDDALADGEGET